MIPTGINRNDETKKRQNYDFLEETMNVKDNGSENKNNGKTWNGLRSADNIVSSIKEITRNLRKTVVRDDIFSKGCLIILNIGIRYEDI